MPAPKYSRETINLACALREDGYTYSRISQATGMSCGAIAWHCLRQGADSPTARVHPAQCPGPQVVQRSGHLVRRFTAEEDREILRLEQLGATISEIARRLNRRHNSVSGRLSTLARQEARKEATG